MIQEFFKLKERNTTIRTEVIAGLTTFLSMSYILFVNPDILSKAGMDIKAVFVATALAAVFGTMMMALYANYPVAQAPGMGMNAFFAFTICGKLGYTWQQGLFAIFISGLLFMIIAGTGLREKIINAIPNSLKYAVSAGVGFFIAFIGLKSVGIVVSSEATMVTLGNLTAPMTLLGIFGIFLTLILIARGVNTAIFIGMVVTAIVGMITGLVPVPTALFASIPSLKPVAFQLFVGTNPMALITQPSFWFVVFSVLFLDFFDTAGTLMGVCTRGGLLDSKGKLIDGEKALMADATATTLGAIIGTSSVTSYAESVVGVEAGGRTGLTAFTTAMLFILALFLSPLLAVVNSAVTAPALVCVGALMASSTKHIDFEDFAETTAAFFTMIFMILSFSIAEGIAIGFLTYTILKVASGQAKKVHPVMYGLATLFAIYFLSKGM